MGHFGVISVVVLEHVGHYLPLYLPAGESKICAKLRLHDAIHIVLKAMVDGASQDVKQARNYYFVYVLFMACAFGYQALDQLSGYLNLLRVDKR